MKMLTKEEAAAEIADFDCQVDEATQAVYRILAPPRACRKCFFDSMNLSGRGLYANTPL